jgi:hypothetical protein
MTDAETRFNNRISKVGLIVLIMAFASLTVVLWTSYQDRKETECQKDVNAAFFTITRERGEIADDDRTAIRTLVGGIQQAETPEEYNKLFRDYDKANIELDRRRAKLIYPDAEKICN